MFTALDRINEKKIKGHHGPLDARAHDDDVIMTSLELKPEHTSAHIFPASCFNYNYIYYNGYFPGTIFRIMNMRLIERIRGDV